jgi:hypothetical protein
VALSREGGLVKTDVEIKLYLFLIKHIIKSYGKGGG